MKIILSLLLIAGLGASAYYFTGTEGRMRSSDADMMQLGDFAYQEKRFEDAFNWYQNAANQGFPKGQMRLAQLYINGEGTTADEEQATIWMKKAAEQGLAQAQYEYAHLLEFGSSERKDAAEIASWYLKAAQNNHPEAMLQIAQRYSSGTGIEKDDYQALTWAIKAEAKRAAKAKDIKQAIINKIQSDANDGDIDSQFTMALISRDGFGVEKNLVASMFWLRKAAQKGNLDAEYTLGTMLAGSDEWQDGLELLKKAAAQGHAQAGYTMAALMALKNGADNINNKEAWAWLYHGMQNEDPKTLYNLATILKLGKLGLPKTDFNYPVWIGEAAKGNVTYAQNDLAIFYKLVNNDTRNSLLWLKRAAEYDEKAQFNLGLIYARGDGTTPNDDHALHWWHEADKNNNVKAELMIGLFYNLGRGVGRSEKEAINWYKKSAEHGEEIAAYNLAMLNYIGRGVDKNYEEAAKYFERLANKGDSDAQNLLASMYQEGQGVTYSPETATIWFRKAAESGNVEAMFNLATQYRSGSGVTQDDRKALYWYTKAAEKNYAPAQNAVGYMYAEGRGTKIDKETAGIWFQRASDNGLDIASHNLEALNKEGSFSLLVRQRIDTNIRDGVLTDRELDLSQWLQPHLQPVL